MSIFTTTWQFKGIASAAKSIDDMITETEKALANLKEMRAAGVFMEDTSAPDNDHFFLATRDRAVAERFGLEPDDEVDG